MEIVGVSYPVTSTSRPPTVTTARIVTLLPLDREEMDSYRLEVVAMDTSHAPLNSSVGVVINVTDRNDNPPVFSQSSVSLIITEGTTYAAPIHILIVS